jgi:capsid protein/2'-5' RNA ligase
MPSSIDKSILQPNWLERSFDRVIAVFNPGKASENHLQRKRYKALAYQGGQRGQRNRQSATIFPNSSPESSLIQLERIQCMWESRSLSDNFGVADYIYNLFCDYCIPDFSKIRWNTGNADDDKKLRERFLVWSKGMCDYKGLDTLNQLIRLAKRSQLRDGDMAFRCVSEKVDLGSLSRKCLRLQLIEADCIGSPFSIVVSPTYIGGLILDSLTKRVLEYDIYDRPPQGSTYIPLAKVPADEIIHFRKLRRGGQYRGIPLLAPALPAYVDLKEILDNERISTKAQSNIWAFIQSPTGDSSDDEMVYPGLGVPANIDPGTGQNRTYKDLTPGTAMYGNPGEQPVFLKNERPSPSFGGLVKCLFMEIFCCSGVDYAFGYDPSDLQGTAMRLTSAKTQRTFQQDWSFNEEYLFDPVVNRWLEHEKQNGYFDDLSKEILESGAYANYSLTQPAHPSADVGRESAANLAELAAKIKSRHTIAVEQGLDWEVERQQLEKEEVGLSGGQMAISESLAKSLGDQGLRALQTLCQAYGTGNITHEGAIGFATVILGLDPASAEKLFPKAAEKEYVPPGSGGNAEAGDDDGKKLSRRFSRGPHGFSAGSKGCVMANLSDEQADPIFDFLKTIDSADLAEDGIESEPHITILYGLASDSQGPVVVACREFGPLKAILGKVEAFENPEYDVLKITVTSPDFEKLNSALKALPYESDFPDYQPHLTLAYLKPGMAKEYVGSTVFAGTELIFDSVVFSDSQKNKRTIKLKEDRRLTAEGSVSNYDLYEEESVDEMEGSPS